MLSITKLLGLPRRLRLRKIANLLHTEERHLASDTRDKNDISPGPLPYDYLHELFLALDEETGLRSAAPDPTAGWATALEGSKDHAALRRLLNRLRYAIYATVGIQAADWDFIDIDGKLDTARRVITPGLRLYLEDLRSPFNVGSIFRSAEAFGVESIALSPLCAAADHPRSRRSAMGCIDMIPWERQSAPDSSLPIFALETGGEPLSSFRFPERGLMIVGCEELGVSPEALSVADASLGRVSIPQWGAKGSLNVAVAVGIALYAWAVSRFNASAGSHA